MQNSEFMYKENKKYELLDQYDFAYNEDEIIFSEEEEYALAIGKFLISFSNLEYALNSLVVESINDRSHDLGYQVIKSLTYANKVKLAKDLCLQQINLISKEKTKNKQKTNYEIIFRALSSIGEFRNKVVHANWVSLDKEHNVRTKIVLNDLGMINFVKIKITPQTILKFASKCNSYTPRVSHFHDKVFQSLI